MKNVLIIAILLLMGCTAQEPDIPKHIEDTKNLKVYSADAEATHTISFKKGAVYSSSKRNLIAKMGDVAVDSSGRVFIADVQKQVIHAFAPTYGQFITQLGRTGNGPGEFSYIKKLQIRNNILYASDANYGVREIEVFTLDTLAKDKTIVLARNREKYNLLKKASPGVREIFVRNNGTYLTKFVAHSSNPNEVKVWQNIELSGMLYLLDNTGKIVSHKLINFIETILTNKTKGLLAPIETFFGTALTVVSKDNTIYWAGPEYFLIKEYSPKGVYQKAFYYPVKKIPLTLESAEKAEVHDYYIQNMENMDLPPHWPVLTDMKIDDQARLWVATTVEDTKIFEWWVLEKSGELITKFEWPRDKPIKTIKNGYLYTQEKNDKSVSSIVKYKINMSRK